MDKNVLYYVGGVVCLLLAFAIWHNGDKIRKSKWWLLAWVSYLLLIVEGFGMLAVATSNEAKAVTVIFKPVSIPSARPTAVTPKPTTTQSKPAPIIFIPSTNYPTCTEERKKDKKC